MPWRDRHDESQGIKRSEIRKFAKICGSPGANERQGALQSDCTLAAISGH
jgi:hypothetical protein